MNNKIVETVYYVSFRLGSELFGISVDKVLEVLENTDISPVPEAPGNVLGVINFRGEIVPVVDLNSRFKIPQDKSLQGVIIVVDLNIEEEKILIGVKVDKVLGVNDINVKNIKNAPEVGVPFNPRFIDGMVHLEQGIILLLNPDLLIGQEDILELDKKN